MSAQLLIYESAVPVSRARHENLSLQVGQDYSFSRNVNVHLQSMRNFSQMRERLASTAAAPV